MDLIVTGNTANWGEHRFPCTIGSNGITDHKREGDGMTPVGAFAFRRAFYRPDRLDRPVTALPLTEITPSCGWCDDPALPEYNRYIQKPFQGSHEDMWMDRDLYNLVIVVGHNDEPVVPRGGSAIFIHLASPEFGPTRGCIGLEEVNLLLVMSQADCDSQLIVRAR
jgi:L,D-peptidoglycan transpeptidase YkuD (ErfK/YbiS/YcfS/YnhG family)